MPKQFRLEKLVGSLFSACFLLCFLGWTLGMNASVAFAQTRTLAQASAVESSPAAEASRQLENAMWEKILAAPSLSGYQRASALVQIYASFSKSRLRSEDEAVVLVAMAVLHSYDRGLRYVALPLIRRAVLRRPNLVKEKDILPVWKIFVQQFGSRSPRDEITLAGIAAALDGSVLAASTDSRFAYFRGSSYFAAGNSVESLAWLSKVGVDSFDYRRTKFIEGANYLAQRKHAEAITAFQIAVAMDATDAERQAGMSKFEIATLRERSVLQIARLLYEEGRFDESLAYYRTLRQDSLLFYESLSEQSWAFFMAGFPNRAMGAAYAAQSSFFAEMFNPDVRFLDAVVSYWLCDFENAKAKISKFIAHTQDEGDILRGLVLRYGNFPAQESLERYSRIAENAAAGVSPQNIGLGPKVLATLLRQVGVGDYLSDLEKTQNERLKFKTDKRYPGGKDRIDYALSEFEKIMRLSIGYQVKNRLQSYAKILDQTLMRMRFLHLEVLTATKDVVVGKGRSVSGNEFGTREQEFADAGQNVLRNWIQDKNEYWFDELGHYVFREQSKCQDYTH